MSAELLTAILGPVVLLMATVALPWFVRRQVTAQAKADREALAAQAKADRDAAAIAASAANEGITMKTINETIAGERDRLTVLLEKESVGHQKEILALQARFTEETERLKQRTDADMDRANQQIRQLVDEVRLLNHRLSGGTREMERPEP